MNDQERANRGLAAQRLLDDELLQEVLAQLDNAYVAAWRQAKTCEAREDAHRYVVLCEKFAVDLRRMTTSGVMADHRIKELEGKQGGLRRIFS